MILELAIVIGLAAAVAVLGVPLGMLVAHPIERLTDDPDEGAHGDD